MKVTQVKAELERTFPGAQVKEEGSIAKVHVDIIKTDQLIRLADLPQDYPLEVELKRSGTGITILVTGK